MAMVSTHDQLIELRHGKQERAVATGDNAAATATFAADTDKSYVIEKIIAGFSGSATKVLTIKEGSTTIGYIVVENAGGVYDVNIVGNKGEALSAELAASGSPGVSGYVTLIGYSMGGYESS